MTAPAGREDSLGEQPEYSMQQLEATLSQTYCGEPLAVIEGLPGGGAELTPAQLRALATALHRIADDAEARKLVHRGKPLPTTRREYRLTY